MKEITPVEQRFIDGVAELAADPAIHPLRAAALLGAMMQMMAFNTFGTDADALHTYQIEFQIGLARGLDDVERSAPIRRWAATARPDAALARAEGKQP